MPDDFCFTMRLVIGTNLASNLALLIMSSVGAFLTLFNAPLEICLLWPFLILVFAVITQSCPVHPVVIFPVFIVFYMTSFAMQVVFFDRQGAWNLDLLRQTVFGGYLVLIGVYSCATVWPRMRLGAHFYSALDRLREAAVPLSGFGRLVFLILACVLIIAMALESIHAVRSGAGAKHEIGSLGRTSVAVYLFLPLFFIFLYRNHSVANIQQWVRLSVLFCIPFFIYFAFTGERDVLIRALLVIFIIGVVNRYISKSSAVVIILCGLLAESLLQSMKAFVVLGIADSNLSLSSIFFGEFSAQGRNYYWAVERADIFASLYADSIWNDILRFFYLAEYSSGSQFGRVFLDRPGGGPGLGFSLLAQLQLAGGYFALVAFGFVSYLILKILEPRSYSIISCLVYGMVLFGISYSFRADFANLLAQIFKVGLMPVITLLAMAYICRDSRGSRGMIVFNNDFPPKNRFI